MDCIILLDKIGYYGPVILFAITFYFLLNRLPYLYLFTFGSIANTLLNHVLKSVFRELRPQGHIGNEQFHGSNFYGLPSGHAQSCFFSLAFFYLIRGQSNVLYLMVFISALTLYQRWKYRCHSIKQLIYGVFIGIFFAWFIIYMYQYIRRTEYTIL